MATSTTKRTVQRSGPPTFQGAFSDGLSYAINVWTDGNWDLVNDVTEYVKTYMIYTTLDAADQYFPDTPFEELFVRVNGVLNRPLEQMNPFQSPVVEMSLMSEKDQLEAVGKAFHLAMTRLMANSQRRIKDHTPFYTKYFTVLVNGKEQAFVQSKVDLDTNIQIYSKARHAAPLELITFGGLMLDAAIFASKIPGAVVNFSYRRDPAHFNQISDPPPRNPAFMAVPMIEIGAVGSNVRGGVFNEISRVQSGTPKKSRNKKLSNFQRGRRNQK